MNDLWRTIGIIIGQNDPTRQVKENIAVCSYSRMM